MGGNDTAARRRREIELIREVAATTRKAVVTGPAGSRLWDIATYRWVEQVDLVIPGSSKSWGSHRTFSDRVYRSGSLGEDSILQCMGIRVATGIRCLYDSYRYYGRTEALVQIESARAQFDLTAATLLDQSQALPSGRGIRGFRELIQYSGGLSFSPLETLKRDALLRAIQKGQLRGVVTMEYQIGFFIANEDGGPGLAWVDILINGFIAIEADGLVKKDGTYGDAVDKTLLERHREVELQKRGAIVLRTSWHERNEQFIEHVQLAIDLNPGTRVLPNRSEETYREFLTRIGR